MMATEASPLQRSFTNLTLLVAGSTVAKFSGDTVYSRLRATDEFRSKRYEDSLRRTFLATDEELRRRASAFDGFWLQMLKIGGTDADFQGDPSGCTAVAVLIDEEQKIYCVCPFPGIWALTDLV
jgi:protein phosphatase 2C family protein 2/3